MPEHATNAKGAIDNGMLPLFRNRHSSETEKGNYICSMRKRLRKGVEREHPNGSDKDPGISEEQ